MTRDISDLLTDAVEEQARDLGGLMPAPVRLARVRALVRRRRIVRRSAEAGAGVAAAAVVAAVVIALTATGGPQPAVTGPATTPPAATTPATTTPPTPTPMATPSTVTPATTAAEPELLPPRLGLPAVYALPDDIWGRTGPGWALGVYHSLRFSGADPRGYWDPKTPGVVDALVLAAPDGTLYLVRDVTDLTLDVASWQAGSTSVLLLDGRTMDLATGDITGERNGLPEHSSFLGTTPAGRQLWENGSTKELMVGNPVAVVASGATSHRLGRRPSRGIDVARGRRARSVRGLVRPL